MGNLNILLHTKKTKQLKWPFKNNLPGTPTGLETNQMEWPLTEKKTNLVTVLKKCTENLIYTKKEFYCNSQLWTFLWCLRASQFRKVLVQERHTNLTPKWSLCTCVHIAACEVDGPSLHPQPGIYTPFWCPHIQAKGCHVGGNGYLESLWDSWGGSLWCQSNQRLQVQLLQTPEEATWIWWQWGHGNTF